jgi:hypothetical protein
MPAFDPLDFERLMRDLGAAPTRGEARVILGEFYDRDGALTEAQTERVADVILEKPDE